MFSANKTCAPVALSFTVSVVITCGAMALLTGCGQRVAEVSGTVQYKGKSVTSGMVTMVGVDGVPNQAQIKEDGTYKLTRVPFGEVTVVVSSPPLDPKKGKKVDDRIDPSSGKKIEKAEGNELPTASQLQKDTWRAIPIEYSDITKGKLKATITSNVTVHDILMN